MSNRYWGGRPKARQANVMLILAGVLVGVVLGFGLASFVDIDLQERLDSLRGGPAPVAVAKQYVREVLQPAEEKEIDSSYMYTSFDFDWEYGEPVCTSGAGEGDCREYNVPTTMAAKVCLGELGSEVVRRFIIHVDTENKTAIHTWREDEEPRNQILYC